MKNIDQQKAAIQVAENTLAQIKLTYPEKIREAEANFTYARLAFEREKALIQKEYTTKDALDKAESQFQAAEAILKRLKDEFATQEKITAATIRETRAQLEQQEVLTNPS